jgi:hypothetical protein
MSTILESVKQLSKAQDAFRQGNKMQVNVYLYTPCHDKRIDLFFKKVGTTGSNHAYLSLDELKQNVILTVPTIEKTIILTPDMIRTMRKDEMDDKTALRIDGVIIPGVTEHCSIYLSECNEKERSYNGIKCLPTLSPGEIGLFLRNALLFIRETREARQAARQANKKEVESVIQGAYAEALGLPPAPTHPVTKTGGKSRKNKKFNNKSKGKTHKRKNNKKSRKRNLKMKRPTRKTHK